MTTPDHHAESTIAVAAKAGAYVTTGGASILTIAGIALQDWVVILTLIIAAMTIAEKAWKWVKAWRERNK